MVTNRHRYRKETKSWNNSKINRPKILDFIIIGVLRVEQQHYSDRDIITISTTPIINSYLNKHTMSWELIHWYLLHPSDSVMKSMWHNQNLIVLPKHCPDKLNNSPWTIWYTSKMKNSPKGTTVDTTNLQPGELIHMDFDFYNMTSIRGFTSMLTVVCENNRMI